MKDKFNVDSLGDHPFVKIAVADLDGILRGKVISQKKLLKCLDEGLNFCNVIFGWDMHDTCYDFDSVSGWHTGFPDGLCSLHGDTLRHIPWEDNMPFFLGDFENDPALKEICPRTLLKRIATDCNSMGFHPRFSAEFEWFNFAENPQGLAQKDYADLNPITPGMFGYSLLRPALHREYFKDLYSMLPAFGIPLEGLHTETGNGVYEGAIHHADVVQAADNGVLFKSAVKEIAYRHQFMASFMAKYNPALPGCGGHVHQSLWDADQKRNLFYDAARKNKISALLQHYIAGQLYCMPSIMPMYAHNVNSYRRYAMNTWAPVSVTWSIENRTTALRVVNSSEGMMNLETRMPGADTNPYLTMAASLASGLYGIRNKLTLADAVTGNAYHLKDVAKLPTSLEESVSKMRDSPIAIELFGERFVRHFVLSREWECRQVDKDDDRAELKRYFELV
jgi:glutamine synthetase